MARRVCCTYHCSSCDSCFSSLVAFDLHRQGSFEAGERHCVDPDEVRTEKPWSTLVVKTEHGFCNLRQGEPSLNATIFQTEEAAQTGGWTREGRETVQRESTDGSTDLPLAA